MLAGAGIFVNGQAMRYTLTDGTVYEKDSINFGLGGQAGLKLDLTNTVNLIFMLNANYTFVNLTANFSGSSAKWSVNSNISINPYIGIGFNRYNKKWSKS